MNVLYCYSLAQSCRADIAVLKQRFPHAKLIMLQHHLFMLQHHLFTNKDVAELVNGRITLPFLGSRFERMLRTPLLSSEASLNQERPLLAADAQNTTRILIVEDNLMNQKIATFFLEKAGLEYVIVSNGQEAVDIVTQGGQFSAVLMDCMMPVMDGFTATRKIREWEAEKG